MSPHMDYAVAPLFDIVVLGAKSPGEVPFHRAFADGRRLARELEPREDKRAADVLAGRLCCELLSRGSQVREIRRCSHLTSEHPTRNEVTTMSPTEEPRRRIRPPGLVEVTCARMYRDIGTLPGMREDAEEGDLRTGFT